MKDRQAWLIVAASGVSDSQTIYSRLKLHITVWAQVNIDGNGNVTYHIITTETGLASVKRYLTKKSNMEKLGIVQSGVLENGVQKGWPRKTSLPTTGPIEQKEGPKKQTAFQQLVKKFSNGTNKAQSDKNT